MKAYWKHLVLSGLCLLAIAGLAIGNDFYNHGGFPATGSVASSSGMRAELDLIAAGFDKLPSFTGNANKPVLVNGSATGLTTSAFTMVLGGNVTTGGALTVSGAFATTLTVTGATTVTLPTTGTLATLAGSETLTTKTINLTSNTLTGTTAQFNTALSDNDFATLAGSETLTTKTINLTSNTLTGTTAQFNTALSDNDFATLAGSETLTTKTINLASNTLSGTTAQFNTALSDNDFATLVGSEVLTNKTLTSPVLNTQVTGTAIAGQADMDAATSSTKIVVPSLNRLTLGTAVATTSGTSFNFASIPAGTRRVTINFSGVSLSGADDLLVQIGPSGGVETSAYVSSAVRFNNTPGVTHTSTSSGFIIRGGSAAYVASGALVLTLLDASTNHWVASGVFKHAATEAGFAAGNKSLADVLSQLTVKTDGANTFDAGSLNIMYER